MDRLREIQYTLENTLATYRENGWLGAAKDVEDAIKLLRAGQAAVTKLQDLLEGGDIAGASEKHYDKLSASVWKVIEAWDAALGGEV